MARPIMWLRTRPDHNRTNKQLIYLDEEYERQQQQNLRNKQQQQQQQQHNNNRINNNNDNSFFLNDFDINAKEKLLLRR